MIRRILTWPLALALLAAACGGDADGTGPVRVMTHDSFAVSDELLESFTAETGIEVELLPSGDAGSMVSQALLVAGNPTADVLFGIDNTLLSRALDADLYAAHRSSNLDDVPEELWIEGDVVTPIDFGDVCLNYDKARLGELGIDLPSSLVELTQPAYEGTLVVENPASSSPGLAFMLATIATFGEVGDYTWLDFWSDLRANDVLVVSGWEQAYFDEFAGGDGDLPFVVSYASSPPVGVVFADPTPDEAPTGNIDLGCFRQIEYAGVLDGTARPEAAGRFIDFMLSRPFQEDLPLNMFVFPVLDSASLPDVFVENVDVPQNVVTIDPAEIEANRERWIAEWTDVFR
jgi:thiamine transport system substrate-binding protein